ncbi:hypothetical protein AB0J35_05050 [Nonomuraea angiospora]|uniref:hypothetical protein n=1 Tax=Nonomuraea angiospora TaxID=46172 RepID=UPI003445768A
MPRKVTALSRFWHSSVGGQAQNELGVALIAQFEAERLDQPSGLVPTLAVGFAQVDVAEFAGVRRRMPQNGADDTEQLASMVLIEDQQEALLGSSRDSRNSGQNHVRRWRELGERWFG